MKLLACWFQHSSLAQKIVNVRSGARSLKSLKIVCSKPQKTGLFYVFAKTRESLAHMAAGADFRFFAFIRSPAL